MMNSRAVFLKNLILTTITVIVLAGGFCGCTTEQLEQAQTAVQAAQPALTAAAPAMVTQPWYVFVLLAMDIASSALAAIISFKKKTENQ